jgi:hypothetical protein
MLLSKQEEYRPCEGASDGLLCYLEWILGMQTMYASSEDEGIATEGNPIATLKSSQDSSHDSARNYTLSQAEI